MAFEKLKDFLFGDEEEEYRVMSDSEQSEGAPRRRGSLLSFHAPRGDEIFIRYPKSQDDARTCADYLRARCGVIVNLQTLEESQARRVFDFLSGVTYAIDGHMEEAGDGIFLITPRDFEIINEPDQVSTPDDGGFWRRTS